MNARDAILDRIRDATRDSPLAPPIPRSYRTEDGSDLEARLELFVEILTDYRATLRRVRGEDVATAVEDACRARGATRVVVPGGFPEAWRPTSLPRTDDNLTRQELVQMDGVVTTCALAIAQTGTIVLDGGPGQGRRDLTLVPDYHLCVIRSEQVVGLVAEAVERLSSALEAGRALTLISGPSATSDIELQRVEGVHGPRTLEVLLVAG